MLVIGAIIAAMALSILWPVLRFFMGLAILAVFIIAFTGGSSNSANVAVSGYHILTYKELENYPVNCANKDSQLAELRKLQNTIGFNKDPDELSDSDRVYNARLKSTIWWYSYRCE
jgi:hypothetical protein